MDAVRRFLIGQKGLAAALLGLSLLLRALVPAGYMVAPAAATAGAVITICTGVDGPARAVALPLRPDRAPQPDGQPVKDTPCAFAVLAGLAVPVADCLHPAVPAAAGDSDHRPPGAQCGRTLAAPPPPATGPPGRA